MLNAASLEALEKTADGRKAGLPPWLTIEHDDQRIQHLAELADDVTASIEDEKVDDEPFAWSECFFVGGNRQNRYRGQRSKKRMVKKSDLRTPWGRTE